MEEIIVFTIGWFFRILYFVAVEGMFYEVFYYIGAAPVYIFTGGRLPTKDPTKLPKKDRRWYALIGVIICILLAWYGLSEYSQLQETDDNKTILDQVYDQE